MLRLRGRGLSGLSSRQRQVTAARPLQTDGGSNRRV